MLVLMLVLMFYSACVFLHARVTELWLHLCFLWLSSCARDFYMELLIITKHNVIDGSPF